MSQNVIDLSELPFPGVVQKSDFETIFLQRVAALVQAKPELEEALQIESDPLTKLVQENAYRELLLRELVNRSAMDVLLAYARDSTLDHLGALLDVERKNDEPDEEYRPRIQQSPYKLSVAGPGKAYRALAMQAHENIKDVAVQTGLSGRDAGKVLVTVLTRTGLGIEEVLQSVDAQLSPEDVRPLNDEIIVEHAIVTAYQVNAIIHTLAGPEGEVVRQAAIAALAEHDRQTNVIEGSVTKSGLYAALRQPGVTEVQLLSPELPQGAQDIIIESAKRTAPKCVSINVTAVTHGQA
jgi:phage-related baseplate assembly protein